jgi:hypothetical protein
MLTNRSSFPLKLTYLTSWDSIVLREVTLSGEMKPYFDA